MSNRQKCAILDDIITFSIQPTLTKAPSVFKLMRFSSPILYHYTVTIYNPIELYTQFNKQFKSPSCDVLF